MPRPPMTDQSSEGVSCKTNLINMRVSSCRFRTPSVQPDHVRCQGPGHQIPTDRAAAPAGAPNVLIILLDDVGFGASSAFGGPCHTPTLEKLAAEGLRYNRFHTCALCAPTRQALLTGRNHHSVGMGAITEIATAAPGLTRP
jgi:hypothetical protein